MFTNSNNTNRSKIYTPNDIAQQKNNGLSIPQSQNLIQHLEPNLSDNSTAVDISGNGNNGSMNAGAYTNNQNGLHGKTFGFYGVSGNINAGSPSTLFPNNSGSMFAWFRFKSVTNRQTIFSGYNGNGSVNRWDLELGTSGQLTGIHHQTSWTPSRNNVCQVGVWHLVGFTCNDGDWVHMYVDGERVSSTAGNNGLNAGANIAIGRRDVSTSFPIDKDVGEAFTWKAELSHDEVRELYQATRTRYKDAHRKIITNGLRGHYDAGVAASYNTGNNQWTDLSGYNNTGYMTNCGPGATDAHGAYIGMSNAQIRIPFNSTAHNWNAGGGISVVGIVKPNQSTHVRPFINQQITAGSSGGGGNAWRLLMADVPTTNDFAWNHQSPSAVTSIITSPFGFTTGEAYFVACTYDLSSGGMSLQVNSRYRTALGSGSVQTAGTIAAAGDIFIGSSPGYNPTRYADQHVYAWLIYNRGLSEAEISELYFYFRDKHNLTDHYRDA
jgi:hypothetical protein